MSQTAARVPTPWVTALVVLILIDALGWALGILPTLRYALTHGDLPTVWAPGAPAGIRGLSGPFKALGIGAMIVAGLLFVVIGGLKVLSAFWIWNRRKDGAVLQLILLALSALFWYGFTLPLVPGLNRSWPKPWRGRASVNVPPHPLSPRRAANWDSGQKRIS